jgi:hypothetical protein
MNDEDITYLTKQALLTRIRKDRADFSALWERLTNEEMTRRPGPQEDWSVKDLIAHITWWEGYTIERVETLLAGGEVRAADIEAINARVFAEHKDQSLGEVLAGFAASLPKVEAQIEKLSEKQLNEGNLYRSGGRSLLDFYIGNTFGHYAMHREDLEGYVEGLRTEK